MLPAYVYRCFSLVYLLCESLSVTPSNKFSEFRRWIYSSTLAYIVDANGGRSSSAIACNSLIRGLGAFIATELAVPLQVCSIFCS